MFTFMPKAWAMMRYTSLWLRSLQSMTRPVFQCPAPPPATTNGVLNLGWSMMANCTWVLVPFWVLSTQALLSSRE